MTTVTAQAPAPLATAPPKRYDALPAPEFLRGMAHVEEQGPPALVAHTCILVAIIIMLAMAATFLIRLEVLSQSPGQLQPHGAARPLQYLDAGYLAELLVEEGDTVTAGSVVARLRVPKYEDDLREARVRQQSLRSRIELRLAFFDRANHTASGFDTLGLWNEQAEILAVQPGAGPPDQGGADGPVAGGDSIAPTRAVTLEVELQRATARLAFLGRLEGRGAIEPAELDAARQEVDRLRRAIDSRNVARPGGLEGWSRTEGILALRRGQLEANLGMLEEQKLTARQTQEIYDDQRARLGAQLQLSLRNVEALSRLRERRLVSETELSNAQRDLIDLQLAFDRLETSVLEGKGLIQELGSRQSEVDARLKAEQLAELEKLLSELQEVDARIVTLEAERSRGELRAPIAGTIHRITKRDIGAVVEPGDVLAELVPSDEPVLAELMVMPSDLPHISRGMRAKISIDGLDPYRYGYLHGSVDYIAPYSRQLEDGASYFTVRVRLEELTDTGQPIQAFIRPGLKVRGMIVIGSRTLAEYLVRPVAKIFEKSFHEY